MGLFIFGPMWCIKRLWFYWNPKLAEIINFTSNVGSMGQLIKKCLKDHVSFWRKPPDYKPKYSNLGWENICSPQKFILILNTDSMYYDLLNIETFWIGGGNLQLNSYLLYYILTLFPTAYFFRGSHGGGWNPPPLIENSKIKNLRCGFDGRLFPRVAKN